MNFIRRLVRKIDPRYHSLEDIKKVVDMLVDDELDRKVVMDGIWCGYREYKEGRHQWFKYEIHECFKIILGKKWYKS